ncbi:MAG TPA: M20 family metallopeptidase [Ktedonobacteraceae bacterium]|nr:M20 family metallopeptidase [Ktedonobacteraceae bacterium]
MAYAHKYFPQLQTYQDEMLQRLETMVNIDSGTGQVEGVNQIILSLKEWLSELGFAVTLHEEEGFGYNLVARRTGRGYTRLLLVGHVDTVYGPGTALTHPFTVRDGLAFGPGVIDMKSSVVMGIYVLRALLEAGFEQYGELCVVFNNDEEVGSPGSTSLIREIARHIDVGLVLEPSRAADVITKSRKGSDKYVLEVFGVPAHSGAEPHKGRSAVIELAHKMLAIHNLNTLFHGVTYNVTRISSSEPLNIVPDVARCHISVRAHDLHSLDLAEETMQRIIAGSSIPDTRSVLTRKPGRKPYKATPEVMQLVTMAQAEGTAFDLELIAEGKGGVSDANTLMEVGVPTLDSLGSIGGGMHDLNREFLRVDSLSLRGAMLAGLIERICLSKSTGIEPSS